MSANFQKGEDYRCGITIAEKEEVLTKSDRLLTNGELKILCVIDIYDAARKTGDLLTIVNSVSIEQKAILDQTILQSGYFADAILFDGDGELAVVHKLRLAANSPVIRQVFEDTEAETVRYDGSLYELFTFDTAFVCEIKSILLFLYTGHFDKMTEKLAKEMRMIAQKVIEYANESFDHFVLCCSLKFRP